MSEHDVAPSRVDGKGVARGVRWSGANIIVMRLGQFLIGILIARIIAPADFGVFVVALTVSTIVINISEIGVSSALIRDARSAYLAPTVTTIAIAFSALLSVLMFATAKGTASALGAASAAGPVRVLALMVLLAGVAATPSAILTKKYMQKELFVARGAFFITSNASLAALALAHEGAYALACSQVIGQCASCLVLVVVEPERYRPGFDRKAASELLRFGVPLAGANLVSFALANADFVVVGRMLGPLRLGQYNLGFNVSGWPVSVFTGVLNAVTLPVLSQARESMVELQRHLKVGAALLGATALPVSALLVALADPLIRVVYGSRWAPAAGALAALAVFGAGRVFVALLSDLLVAVGDTRALFALQVTWLILLVPSLILFVGRSGITGAGIAHSLVMIICVLPAYLVALRLRHAIGIRGLLAAVTVPFLASVGACVTAIVVSSRLHSALSQLCCGALAGLLVYLLLSGYWLRGTFTTVRSLYRASDR